MGQAIMTSVESFHEAFGKFDSFLMQHADWLVYGHPDIFTFDFVKPTLVVLAICLVVGVVRWKVWCQVGGGNATRGAWRFVVATFVVGLLFGVVPFDYWAYPPGSDMIELPHDADIVSAYSASSSGESMPYGSTVGEIGGLGIGGYFWRSRRNLDRAMGLKIEGDPSIPPVPNATNLVYRKSDGSLWGMGTSPYYFFRAIGMVSYRWDEGTKSWLWQREQATPHLGHSYRVRKEHQFTFCSLFLALPLAVICLGIFVRRTRNPVANPEVKTAGPRWWCLAILVIAAYLLFVIGDFAAFLSSVWLEFPLTELNTSDLPSLVLVSAILVVSLLIPWGLSRVAVRFSR